jgi:hypothetical protein
LRKTNPPTRRLDTSENTGNEMKRHVYVSNKRPTTREQGEMLLMLDARLKRNARRQLRGLLAEAPLVTARTASPMSVSAS